jgi:predicted nucleic-acid-binding protein
MREILIDMSIILRLFDNVSAPDQTAKAQRLFAASKDKKVMLIIAAPVLFEVAWVLKNALKWRDSDTLDVLEAIINWPGVKTLDRDHIKRAISLGREKDSGFTDSYLAIGAKDKELELASFKQRHFQKLEAPLFDLNEIETQK